MPLKTSSPTLARGMETKAFSFQVKAIDDDQGLIEAYGSVFNNVDQGDDMVKPGAFKRTIQNSKSRVQSGKAKFLAPMLWQHDPDQPVGGWTDFSEDQHGLLCKGQIILTTDLGRNVYQLIKAGVIDQFSIGYDIPSGGANYDKSTGVRNLTEVRLWEVSPVTFAMNQEALLVGVKSDDKGQNMNLKNKKTTEPLKPEKKTVMDHFNQGMANDCLTDWQDIYIAALTSAIFDAFTIGDTAESDVSTALDDFKQLVMDKFVPQAITCNLSQFIADNTSSFSGAQYVLQNGSSPRSFYDSYMSSNRQLAQKSGRAFSAANTDAIQQKADQLHDMANKAMDMMKEHTKAVHTAADDLANILQGSEAAYGTDSGTPDDGQQEGKEKSVPSKTHASKSSHSSSDTVDDSDLTAFLNSLQTIH